MGISAQQMLGNDPEYLGRQLRQQQIQNYMAPFQSQQDRTAGLLGGLLGGGIANLFGGRGFFDVTDPGLRRVSEVNSIISTGLKDIDPTNPEEMAKAYGSIAKQLANSGYSQPAALAAQEAAKLAASVGAGYKESSNYMTKDGSPALFRNGKYYDASGNELKKDQLRIIPKDALGRIIDTVGTGGPAAAGDTPAAKAAKALAEREAKAKKAAASGKDPFAPAPGDSPEEAVAKAQARAELARQKAEELSGFDQSQSGSQLVAP